MLFQVLHRASCSRARIGLLQTSHGGVETPALLPLATKGAVKALLPEDLKAIGVQILMANAYHLHLQPGHETIALAGGLHTFMGWDGPIMTDSGGFQVFSMWHGRVSDEIKGRRSFPDEARDRRLRRHPQVVKSEAGCEKGAAVLKVSEDGVLFRSYLDGSLHPFSPERSMEIQHALGSDIALVLDECTPYHATYEYTKQSMERTHRWALRCLKVHERSGAKDRQALFGIVQGGVHRDLREESARFVASLPFDGVAIGGSLGKDKEEMFQVVEWTVPHLPEEKPRHLLGIGEPDDLVEGVSRGIDLFDCAFPTRLARHGMLLVKGMPRYRMDVTKGSYARDSGPPDPSCPCPTCRRFSRAYLHHLFKAGELVGIHLATLHNVAWMIQLLEEIRRSIQEGRFSQWRQRFQGTP